MIDVDAMIAKDLDKGELRRKYQEERKKTNEDTLDKASLLIKDRLVSSLFYKNASVVFCYMSIGTEVKTGELCRHILNTGKKLCIPKTNTFNRTMEAYLIKELVNLNTKNKYEIPEPSVSSGGLCNPEKIDLAIIPGIVFDFSGHRIGYGGGYYDRYLPLLKKDCIKVGLTMEHFLIDRIPADAHDFKLDFICTEVRLLQTGI